MLEGGKSVESRCIENLDRFLSCHCDEFAAWRPYDRGLLLTMVEVSGGNNRFPRKWYPSHDPRKGAGVLLIQPAYSRR